MIKFVAIGGCVMRKSLLWCGVLSASLIVSISHLHAQDCAAFARYGLYDVSTSKSDTERAESFHRLFCQQNFLSVASAQSFGLSFGISIFSLGLSNSESDFHQSYSNYCNDEEFANHFRQRTEVEVKKINPNVVQALQECIGKEGFHAWIEQGPDWHSFSLFLRYSKGFKGQDIWTIDPIEAHNAKCDKTPTSFQHAETHETFCKREEEAVTIVINPVPTKDTPLTLSAHQTPPPPKRPDERFILLQSASGNCDARTLQFKDVWDDQIYQPTLFYNCWYINWTNPEKILPQVVQSVGILDDNSRWALVSVSGDCSSRTFQIFDKVAKRTRSVTVANNCARIAFCGPPVGHYTGTPMNVGQKCDTGGDWLREVVRIGELE
jgi:hypothetical protein